MARMVQWTPSVPRRDTDMDGRELNPERVVLSWR